MNENTTTSLLGTVGTIEVKLNLSARSAVYISLAIVVPIIIFFLSKKIFE